MEIKTVFCGLNDHNCQKIPHSLKGLQQKLAVVSFDGNNKLNSSLGVVKLS